jgi:hypothetical protein
MFSVGTVGTIGALKVGLDGDSKLETNSPVYVN